MRSTPPASADTTSPDRGGTSDAYAKASLVRGGGTKWRRGVIPAIKQTAVYGLYSINVKTPTTAMPVRRGFATTGGIPATR